jgi:hypothetical protein
MILCPKCSQNMSCSCEKGCGTRYCLTCRIYFYEDERTKDVITGHHPFCNKPKPIPRDGYIRFLDPPRRKVRQSRADRDMNWRK